MTIYSMESVLNTDRVDPRHQGISDSSLWGETSSVCGEWMEYSMLTRMPNKRSF